LAASWWGWIWRIRGLLPGFIGSMPRLPAVDFQDNKFTEMTQYAMGAEGMVQLGRLLLSGKLPVRAGPGGDEGRDGGGELGGQLLVFRCMAAAEAVVVYSAGSSTP